MLLDDALDDSEQLEFEAPDMRTALAVVHDEAYSGDLSRGVAVPLEDHFRAERGPPDAEKSTHGPIRDVDLHVLLRLGRWRRLDEQFAVRLELAAGHRRMSVDQVLGHVSGVWGWLVRRVKLGRELVIHFNILGGRLLEHVES